MKVTLILAIQGQRHLLPIECEENDNENNRVCMSIRTLLDALRDHSNFLGNENLVITIDDRHHEQMEYTQVNEILDEMLNIRTSCTKQGDIYSLYPITLNWTVLERGEEQSSTLLSCQHWPNSYWKMLASSDFQSLLLSNSLLVDVDSLTDEQCHILLLHLTKLL